MALSQVARRAISGRLTPAKRGFSRPLADRLTRRSGHVTGPNFRTLGLRSSEAESHREPLACQQGPVSGLSADPAYDASADRQTAQNARRSAADDPSWRGMVTTTGEAQPFACAPGGWPNLAATVRARAGSSSTPSVLEKRR